MPLLECVSNKKEQDCNTAREHNWPCHFAIGLSTWHGIWSWCGHNQKLSKDERKIAAYIFITRANSKTDIADNEIYISSGPYPVPLYCMVFLVLRIYEGHGSLISCITFSVSWRCVRKAYYSKDFVGKKPKSSLMVNFPESVIIINVWQYINIRPLFLFIIENHELHQYNLLEKIILLKA